MVGFSAVASRALLPGCAGASLRARSQRGIRFPAASVSESGWHVARRVRNAWHRLTLEGKCESGAPGACLSHLTLRSHPLAVHRHAALEARDRSASHAV
jgi:hypothetical protein